MKTIKVGTRASKLAMAQTQGVVDALQEKYPDIEFEIVTIRSKGDEVTDCPISEIGGHGVFTSALEDALLRGDIDFAVHSMKDLPSEQPEGLMLAPSPARDDPRDCIVANKKMMTMLDLKYGSALGTGSPRRIAQLATMRPDIKAVPIRGNIDTRLSQVGREINGVDIKGVVLAAAGLERLGLGHLISYRFNAAEMIPAPAQGILALELRQGEDELLEILSSIQDEHANVAATAERSFLKSTGADCQAPIGAYCAQNGEYIRLRGMYGTPDGKYITGTMSGHMSEAVEIGQDLAEYLIKCHEEKFNTNE